MKSVAIINLKAIKQNAIKIKKALPKGCKFCAVVKDDAYGHGSVQVATYIHSVADCFAVAFVSEGIKLRIAGVTKDILVLLPPSDEEIERAIRYNLTLSVTNKSTVNKINKCAISQGKHAKIHIKYNTGMNRLGIDGLANLNDVLSYSLKKNKVIVDGVYSHYAFPQDKSALERATDKFLLANKLVKGYNKSITCHISASGGFLQGKFFDMVRVGILLYGYTPFATDKIKVKKAMKVYSPVICCRSLEKGDSALYGTYTSRVKKKIALIPYGYADGLPRRCVKGQFNDRCMDITAVCQNKLKPNSLWADTCGQLKGARFLPVMVDADKTATLYNTISYEVLTKCALRADKFYIK